MNRHGACPQDDTLLTNIHIPALMRKGRGVTSVLPGSWKDWKGSLDGAVRNERESAKEAWARRGIGFTEAYVYCSPNEHKR